MATDGNVRGIDTQSYHFWQTFPTETNSMADDLEICDRLLIELNAVCVYCTTHIRIIYNSREIPLPVLLLWYL